MSHEALSKVLFHGARNEVNDTHIRPPSVTGAPAISSRGFSGGHELPHTQLAFASAAERTAWSYARVGADDLDPNSPVNTDPHPRHRSRVYTLAPAHDQSGDDIETMSPTGFEVTGVHHSEVGATSTFHEINWNAFKGRRLGEYYVPPGDMNHSYMETDPDREPYVAPFREVMPSHLTRHSMTSNGEDPRHPDQLNLFSGKTVAEHEQYNNTPGVSQHLAPGQFQNVAFHRDPTTSTIRQGKDYDRVDAEFGMRHG